MGPEEIKQVLAERPFRPIRIHLSDGAAYEIRHPDMVLVLKRQLIIALQQSAEERVPERYASVNILHITRIEPIEESGSKPKRKRSA